MNSHPDNKFDVGHEELKLSLSRWELFRLQQFKGRPTGHWLITDQRFCDLLNINLQSLRSKHVPHPPGCHSVPCDKGLCGLVITLKMDFCGIRRTFSYSPFFFGSSMCLGPVNWNLICTTSLYFEFKPTQPQLSIVPVKPNASSIIAKDSRCCTLSGWVWKRYSKSFFNLKTSWIMKKWRDKKRRRIKFFCVTTSTPDLDPPHICQELWERSSEIQICHNCFSAWTCRRLHALSPAENNLPILEVVGEGVMEVGKEKVEGKWKQRVKITMNHLRYDPLSECEERSK